MSSEVERPLRADAERNRQRILAAAREVFADRGVDAGLDEIARHAGVGTGTVYRRFPDKQLLIDALFENHFDLMRAIAEEALEVENSWDALVQYLTRGLEMMASNRGLAQLILGTAHGREGMISGRERLIPIVIKLVERAKADGYLRPDLALTDFPAFYLQINTLIAFFRDTDPDAWRRYLALWLDGMRARRDGPSPLPREALTLPQLDAAFRSRPRGF